MSIKMVFQRCMVLFAIFLCYMEASADNEVDCEKHPYYHTCRGTMLRKRTMIADNRHGGLNCDDSKGDLDCIALKNYIEKQRRLYYGPLFRSKLWMALHDARNSDYDGYSTSYDRGQDRRKNSENDYEGRKLVENFWSELENSENDY